VRGLRGLGTLVKRPFRFFHEAISNKMSDAGRVIFFFPYHEVSGVPVLFLRMALALSERHGLQTAVVDFPEGYMMRNLPSDCGVDMISFSYGSPCPIESTALLIVQSMPPYKFPSALQLAPETRIVFWTLFQYNLGSYSGRHGSPKTKRPIWTWFRDSLAGALDHKRRCDVRSAAVRLSERRSLWFCDAPNLRATSEILGTKFRDPVIVPVPSGDVCESSKRTTFPNRLGIGWLGRLSDFKIHILVHTVDRMRRWAEERRVAVKFHVIGDGREAGLLEPYGKPTAFFELIRPGVLDGPRRDDYILQNIDLMGAMGTSALDALRLGIPTLRLDPSYEVITGDYLYQWIWESGEVNFGDFVGRSSFEPGNRSLETRCGEVLSDYERLSAAGLRYYEQWHALGSVAQLFVQRANEAQFRFSDFRAAELRKGLIRGAYERLAYRSIFV
jgi:hypothetical protein